MNDCEACRRPTAICVCDRTVPMAIRTQVVVLQHPAERDVTLGTAGLLAASISARCVPGLSWPNLRAAAGGDATPARWAVVFPGKGGKVAQAPVDGLILLDGTWRGAKSLWWRNPWLTKLPRLGLTPSEPSIYGRMRREPDRFHVSTLEAAAEALVWNGEDAAVAEGLRKLMRTMVQRARDAQLG